MIRYEPPCVPALACPSPRAPPPAAHHACSTALQSRSPLADRAAVQPPATAWLVFVVLAATRIFLHGLASLTRWGRNQCSPRRRRRVLLPFFITSLLFLLMPPTLGQSSDARKPLLKAMQLRPRPLDFGPAAMLSQVRGQPAQ